MSDAASVEHVIQLVATDGMVAREVAFSGSELDIGRTGASFSCPEDEEMADRHARLDLRDGKVMLRDASDGAGVWLRIQGSEGRALRSGDQIWVGAQILIVKRNETGWEIRHHGPDGRRLKTHPVPTRGLFIGRASDLVLDVNDARLSRRHAQLVPEGEELRLYDRGAHNGTYLKLRTEEELTRGTEFRISANRFRYVEQGRARQERMATDGGIAAAPIARSKTDLDEDETVAITAELNSDALAQSEQPKRSLGLGARLRQLGRGFDKAASPAAGASDGAPARDPGQESADAVDAAARGVEASIPSGTGAESQPPEMALAAGKCLVVMDSEAGSVSLEVSEGQTILEAVQEAGLARGEPVDWECGDGGCGVCVMGVLEGADRLDPPDDETGEMRTIQVTEQVVPDPSKYRLACLARVRGTVRLRKLT